MWCCSSDNVFQSDTPLLYGDFRTRVLTVSFSLNLIFALLRNAINGLLLSIYLGFRLIEYMKASNCSSCLCLIDGILYSLIRLDRCLAL